MNTNVLIETDRLILREFKLNDAQAVYNFASDVEVQEYTGDAILTKLNQAKEIIEHVWFSDYKKYGYGRWAVVYKPENKVIGFAGLKYLPELNETDIGFRFLPEYWGIGIATEVSREILKYGFETLKLEKILGIVMPKNIASFKVLEKLGFNFYKLDSYDGGGEKCNWYEIDRESYLKLYNNVSST
ncbi:GNAT family N-acetyltransferase [Lutibacter sp.]|uniref:GNAT family N-acetyltransferase n=1 Tax=Lutibacter sp. TaxID=1925666 RepID=UPI0025C26D11|nr:GNAT family N-acetyltransferase [Lutibacter sp.]MCF6169110.1 GNAT family N-acetyltransferase [Lutibacter sp.]